MNRRSFLAATSASLVATPLLAGQIDFVPGLIEQELAAGKTVFLDYTATWCTTCAAQERVMNALRAENPAYDANISFIDIDWDTYRDHEVTTSRNIPRRSTLVVLKGDAELGRVVAGTSLEVIKGLMDIALAAATTA